MVPLTHGRAFWYDNPFTSFYVAGEIRLELGHFHLVVAMYRPYFAIVVKQYRQVVYVSSEVVVFPRTLRRLRGKQLQSVAVYVGKHVERTVVIAYHWRPYTLSVHLFAVLQTEFIIGQYVFPAFETITCEVPVYEVLTV